MSLSNFAKSLIPHSLRERYRYFASIKQHRQARDTKFRSTEERLGRLKTLQAKYAGQHCVIMGNGPSLNKMDLSVFQHQNVWCTNRAYLLFDRVDWRPAFYTGVDRRVIPDVAGELNKLHEELPGTQFFWPEFFHEQGVLNDHPRSYWFRERTADETQPDTLVFSHSCHDYVVHPRTVTITALQLAAYLGFNPIYLIGCDTNYKVPVTVKEKLDSNELTSTKDDDENHFDPRYFGAGKKWHQPHPERMIRHYQSVRAICEPMGVEIFNATVGGMLEVFPRVDYREIPN